MTYTGIGSWLL